MPSLGLIVFPVKQATILGSASELPFNEWTKDWFLQRPSLKRIFHPRLGFGKIKNLKQSLPTAIFLCGAVYFKVIGKRRSKTHIATARGYGAIIRQFERLNGIPAEHHFFQYIVVFIGVNGSGALLYFVELVQAV